MGVARAVGRGVVTVSPTGLSIEGRVTRAPPLPPALLGGVGVGLVLVGAIAPGAERVVLPLLLVATLGGVWMGWRAEYGASGRFEMPWSSVEHVVRLPADPDVVAILFAGPLAGTGSPEQVYFAPSNGIEALAAALREGAPALTIDLDSALREAPEPEPE